MIEQIKKNLGAFYTPIHTAKYMVGLFNSINEESKILEPCGGDGVFVKALLQKGGIKPEQIEVWDINPQLEQNIKKFGVKFVVKDTLLNTDFNSLFRPTFTHIIGNPPYLNKQSLYIKRNKEKLRKLYKEIGVNDTYAMFLYLCGNLLSKNGELVFIISDTYRTLGIHKKLRHWLLTNFTIKEIILCPPALFKDKGTMVKTSIIHLVKSIPSQNHKIEFNDCRENDLGDYNGKIWLVPQLDILKYPDYVFYFENNRDLLKILTSENKKIIDFLDGGLGMHTTNNKKYLALIDYKDKSVELNKKYKNIISFQMAKRKRGWRIYHKTGGNNKYYKKPTFAIKWDTESIKKYKNLKNVKKYEGRQGFIISGVCSTLSARLSYKGALWESNKAMCFFPKDPQKYPVYFFIGILNSKPYNEMIKIINHTNSIQIRDIKKLPMLNFSDKDIKKISQISKFIIDNLKRKEDFNFQKYQDNIDEIILKYIKKSIQKYGK
jgi:tRNA1(Val) A37 N6-methylase TrmN6